MILLKDQVPAVRFWPLCLGQSILTVNAGCDTNHFHCPVGQCRVFCMWFEELEYLPVLYHKIQPLQIQRDIRVAVPVFKVQVLCIRTRSETENLYIYIYIAKFEKVQVRKLRLKPFLWRSQTDNARPNKHEPLPSADTVLHTLCYYRLLPQTNVVNQRKAGQSAVGFMIILIPPGKLRLFLLMAKMAMFVFLFWFPLNTLNDSMPSQRGCLRVHSQRSSPPVAALSLVPAQN